MTKLRVAVALIFLVLIVLVLHSCRGGSGQQSATPLPDVDNGVVSIPACSSDTNADATRVRVLRPQPGGYQPVQACLGVSDTGLTRIKQLGAVGIPADDSLILIALNLQENRFRICGLSDRATGGDVVTADLVSCPSGGN